MCFCFGLNDFQPAGIETLKEFKGTFLWAGFLLFWGGRRGGGRGGPGKGVRIKTPGGKLGKLRKLTCWSVRVGFRLELIS